MYPRTSIYDRLQRRPPSSPEEEKPQSRQFDTLSITVRDSWLIGGFGSIEDVALDGMPPPACDYSFDPRLRDDNGHFIGVARVDVGQEPELALVDRAHQLLSHAIPELVARGVGDDKQVVLQLPMGSEPDEWLDTALALWPIQRQPTYGITVTSLSFDQWLQTVLSLAESPIEHYQFVAVSPLVPDLTSTITPKGESVVSIWLQRLPVRGSGTSPPQLLLPARQEHSSRGIAARRDASALKHAVADSFGENCDCDEIGVVVWDGMTSGNRLDHLTTFLQSDFEHLYMDTDVWSLQALCGLIGADPLPYLAVLALKLCESRKQNVLILDSYSDTDTAAMLLRHHDMKAS